MINSCQENAFSPKQIQYNQIKKKKIGIIGLGGIGSLLTTQLTHMGFDHLLLVDGDTVDESNLSRQQYTVSDIGFPKTDSLKKKLLQINPNACIDLVPAFLTNDNLELLNGCDAILDATDNMNARYLINHFSFRNDTPWIYASSISSLSVVGAFIPTVTPCFECLYGPEQQEVDISCSIEGVMLPALMDTVGRQITLLIQTLSSTPIETSIVTKDIWNFTETSFDFGSLKDDNCPSCSDEESTLLKTHFLMKCNGNATDVWTTKTKLIQHHIENQYTLIRENDLFIEYTFNDKRILIYPELKATLHHFNKEEVESLFADIS